MLFATHARQPHVLEGFGALGCWFALGVDAVFERWRSPLHTLDRHAGMGRSGIEQLVGMLL
jgi:hypothetical protein